MKNLFNQIKNHIDDTGKLISSSEEIKSSILAAEQLAESLLGCTLNVRGKEFIIRMLEIYYGGVGDDAHDWYRTRFSYKTSKYKEQTSIQSQDGFSVYLSSLDVSDTYTRMDIVVGHTGVPISFLLRSAWDSSFNLIGAKNGNPNIVLNAIGFRPEDHGQAIDIENKNAELYLENTHEQIINDRGFQIKRQRRINLKSEFEEKNQVQWNLSLE
ncbi:hypothetical protein [Haliscomenobacter sp.]|uniref:hypothetical protein n=1 Tax=Haliscomenobacter sp. TaxID=2717303 RepID=UPI003592FDAB